MNKHLYPKISRFTQLLASIGALLPMTALTLWMYVVRDTSPGLAEFFLGPLLVGGGMIFWLLYLQLIICRSPLSELGINKGRPWHGLLLGCLMGLFFLGLKLLTDPWLTRLFPRNTPNPDILQLIYAVANDPWLLALWLGPVVWIGIAGFEELWRVFMLVRIQRLLGDGHARWIAVVTVSTMVGAAHGYQGMSGAISIGFKSLLMCSFFVKTKRIWPLIVAHAIYDSVQIIMAVTAIRQLR